MIYGKHKGSSLTLSLRNIGFMASLRWGEREREGESEDAGEGGRGRMRGRGSEEKR